MPDYEKLYFELLGEISDAADLLIAAMRKAEEAFCEDGAPDWKSPPADGEPQPLFLPK